MALSATHLTVNGACVSKIAGSSSLEHTSGIWKRRVFLLASYGPCSSSRTSKCAAPAFGACNGSKWTRNGFEWIGGSDSELIANELSGLHTIQWEASITKNAAQRVKGRELEKAVLTGGWDQKDIARQNGAVRVREQTVVSSSWFARIFHNQIQLSNLQHGAVRLMRETKVVVLDRAAVEKPLVLRRLAAVAGVLSAAEQLQTFAPQTRHPGRRQVGELETGLIVAASACYCCGERFRGERKGN